MESFYPSPYRPIMARRKRSLDEMALATKSDSDDDDYSDREVRAKRTSRTKSKKSKPSKRNRRQGSDDDDIVSDDEEMLSEAEDMSFHESEFEDETNAQRNARGLVARRAATKRPAYNEGASTSEDELGIGADDDDEEEEDLNPPQKKRKSTIVTLKIPNTDKMLQALEPNRRTTRRTRGASEDIYALTNSGRHMEAVGRATHSPEADEPLQKRRASRETRASKNVVTGDTIVEKTGEYEVDETMTDFKGSQVEIMESAHASFEESAPTTGDPTQGNTGAEEGFVPESENGDVKHDQEDEDDEDDEDDEGPTTRRRMRASRNQPADEEPQQGEDDSGRRRSSRKKLPRSSQRKATMRKATSSLKRTPTMKMTSLIQKQSLKRRPARATRLATMMMRNILAADQVYARGRLALVDNQRQGQMLQVNWPRSCMTSGGDAHVGDCNPRLSMRNPVAIAKTSTTELSAPTSSYPSKRQKTKLTSLRLAVVEVVGAAVVVVGNARFSQRMVHLEAPDRLRFWDHPMPPQL